MNSDTTSSIKNEETPHGIGKPSTQIGIDASAHNREQKYTDEYTSIPRIQDE